MATAISTGVANRSSISCRETMILSTSVLILFEQNVLDVIEFIHNFDGLTE
jgi:hypothetical protein